MVKAGDSRLKLSIQHRTVSHNDHGVENGLVCIIMQTGEPIGGPCDGIRLTGTCTMLNQIVLAGTVGLYIPNQRSNSVHLMIAGENNFLFRCVIIDELLNDVQ